ncbi:MAG TPA: hypothetical protein VG406_18490 [Isosphaeraceae bacterium]|jgi:hypothetical protein|nr:hypothetical protein [Isosphaeraceae bacterium]
MALNPLRDALRQAGAGAFGEATPFRAEADDALIGFRALRDGFERQVRRGDLTPKVARERAAEAAGKLGEALRRQADGYSPAPRAFLDRLVEASNARARAREGLSLEGLQRETNRLLRRSLIEQQLVGRAHEFEGRAFVRPMIGGPPAPTLDSLLDFHETAVHAGDEAAQEWGRRQLEGYRNRVLNADDHRKIDRACDRPEAVNPRTVVGYVEAIRGRGAEELEAFVGQALAAGDASACAAAFVLAREAPEGPRARLVRSVLEGLGSFPDAAIESLRAWEADARRSESEAARAQADFAAALAEAEARFPGLDAPTDAELARRAREHARPVARLDQGEPIGLALDRRGLDPDELRPAPTAGH